MSGVLQLMSWKKLLAAIEGCQSLIAYHVDDLILLRYLFRIQPSLRGIDIKDAIPRLENGIAIVGINKR